MPTYEYICSSCRSAFERILKIVDRKIPESDPCPICGAAIRQQTLSAPSLGDPVRLGYIKPDNGFKEVLQRIHEKSPKSTLNDSSNVVSI